MSDEKLRVETLARLRAKFGNPPLDDRELRVHLLSSGVVPSDENVDAWRKAWAGAGRIDQPLQNLEE